MLVKQIIVHHTASSRDKTTLKDVNYWHKTRDFTLSSLGYYVGYHYLILADGTLIQTRRDTEIGCHCIPNTGKLGICLTGNFQIEKPTSQQINALSNLLNDLKKSYNLDDNAIKGHRELSNTECPGDNLFKWILEQRISFLQKLVQWWKKK